MNSFVVKVTKKSNSWKKIDSIDQQLLFKQNFLTENERYKQTTNACFKISIKLDYIQMVCIYAMREKSFIFYLQSCFCLKKNFYLKIVLFTKCFISEQKTRTIMMEMRFSDAGYSRSYLKTTIANERFTP